MDLHLYIPFEKIGSDEERTVSGWATTEQPDYQGDIVAYEGACDAMKRFGGAVREMHQPRAVGKLLEWTANDSMRAVWVKTFISKSRDGEDAWTKIKEGVLKGFSIGGRADGAAIEYVNLKGQNYRKLNRLDISEISLVDEPANPGAKIMLYKAAIPHIEGEPQSPPKGYPANDAEYGDPANHSWPVDTEGRARSAISYYNGAKGKDKYSDAEWTTLGNRLARLISAKLGNKYTLKDGSLVAEEKKKMADEVQVQVAKNDLATAFNQARQLLDTVAENIGRGEGDGALAALQQAASIMDANVDALAQNEQAAEMKPASGDAAAIEQVDYADGKGVPPPVPAKAPAAAPGVNGKPVPKVPADQQDMAAMMKMFTDVMGVAMQTIATLAAPKPATLTTLEPVVAKAQPYQRQQGGPAEVIAPAPLPGVNGSGVGTLGGSRVQKAAQALYDNDIKAAIEIYKGDQVMLESDIEALVTKSMPGISSYPWRVN